jgi:hypothetical protein
VDQAAGFLRRGWRAEVLVGQGSRRARCAVPPSPPLSLVAMRPRPERLRQVFYKFATRAGGIYPTDAAAHKAAALEITAMNAVVDCNNTLISVAVTSLFLICGHCVIATAMVPLEKSGRR